MRNKSNIYCVLFLLLITCEETFAQLTVVEGAALGMTPLELVSTQLVGQGITVSNATFNGSNASITSAQIGKFSTTGVASEQLQLDAGIILSSGKVSGSIGPNNTLENLGTRFYGPGDQDLTVLAGNPTHDASLLEFDFVPVSDTVKFRYVFGSEEMPVFCGMAYNDAFGFFLSGPGITGTFSNNSEDLARMPDGLNYVTINNICSAQDSYWDNPVGGIYYQYNRFTLVFTAWHVVQPCQVYHIKLAIGDAHDFTFDSGVFLQKNSFTSPGIVVNTTYSNPAVGNMAFEGCSNARITFHTAEPVAVNDTIHFTLSGTAVNGIDFPAVPADYVVIYAGTDSAYFIIEPGFDGVTEGEEYTILTVPVFSCAQGLTFTDTIRIEDNTPFHADFTNDTALCEGSSLVLEVTGYGGVLPYSYLWNTGDTVSSVNLNIIPGTATYWARVTDLCGMVFSDTIHVQGFEYSQILNSVFSFDLCSGSLFNLPIITNVASVPVLWTASSTEPLISGFSGGNGNSISQTLFTGAYSPGSVIYHVWTDNSGCPGDAKDFTVSVIPRPVVSFSLCTDPVTLSTARPIKLKRGIPAGGVFSGPGVAGGIFTPGVAGAGSHTLWYKFNNLWNCGDSASATITVVTTAPFTCGDTLTDIRDNEKYPTVQIMNQCWMAENLNYGSGIVSNQMQSDNCITEKYCPGDIPSNCNSSGGLYQWDEMMQYDTASVGQGICPSGWHLPSEQEWDVLFSFYTNNAFAGSNLKYSGFSGFNANLFGAGFSNIIWHYNLINFASFFWSASSYGPYKAWAHAMNELNPSVSYYPASRSDGFSVRCVKD